MARTNVHQLAYTAIRIEGGLIPADELTRLTALNAPEKTEQTEAYYNIPKGLKLRDEVARNFKIAQNLWQDFQQLRQRQDVDAYDATTRDFLVPLFRHALGYTDLAPVTSLQATNNAYHSYQIGHAALNRRLPVVIAAHNQSLDYSTERFGETNSETGRIRRRSPFMLAQEALNATDASLWAVVSNGLTLRILRDNPSLTRPAYVEVDLEAIFNEELYSDFTAFWLLVHVSRFGQPDTEPADCPWERWYGAGQQAGVTVRQNLRYQVADALRSLGTGFLRNPANATLRSLLHDPELGSNAKQAFFEELLSLVYRLIFLATVEDRTDPSTGRSLIFTPDATEQAQQLYRAGYSLTWLRERAARRSSHDTHSDLWQALSITFDGLASGQPALGLPALGGLFQTEQCPLLNTAHIDNRYLLTAVFQLGYFRHPSGLTRVNYRDMGAEELGSVYESLLELVPDIQSLSQPHAAKLGFVGDDDDASNKGNARKLTGSYYTPDSLVQELIKSALEPVIEQTVKNNASRPVEALLQLTVCDPACGSGHFLLAAARRMADEVAKLRAAQHGGAPTPTDYRHALRDVVGHCIYGVDKNPMAIALAKTALWLEAYSPDRPLTFIDHHLQVGDALLGVLDPKILEYGIPDEAYSVLSGDDKATAGALKKQNKADLKSWKQVVANDLFAASSLATVADAVEHLADDTLEGIATKRNAWHQAHVYALESTLAKLADTYVAAFLAPKVPGNAGFVPLSGYLWGLLHSDSHSGQNAALGQAVYDLCRTNSVFHWWLAFPQIAAQGGFSVMLGNPPWERIKLQEEEFFATRSPLVAGAKNKAERAQRIDLLRRGMLLHTLYPDLEAAEGLSPPNSAEMQLYTTFIASRRGAEAASLYAHDGGRYPLTGVGDVNTYALFAETFFQLTRIDGRAGFVVPSGIATDDSTKAFFGTLVKNRRLYSLLSCYEIRRWFPGTDDRKPFCMLTIGASEMARFVCDLERIDDLSKLDKWYTLKASEFKLLNPNTLTLPIFRSQRDAELTKKLYSAAPVLIREAVVDGDGKDVCVLETEVNPWGITFQRMMDMSNDSYLFSDRATDSNGTVVRVPLYEAKMVHQFDHRWATYVDSPEKPGGLDTEDVSIENKGSPVYAARPRYWVDEREVLARIARVPSRVANAWLIWRYATDAVLPNEGGADEFSKLNERRQALTLVLAGWVAGAMFRRTVTSDATSRQSAAKTADLFDEPPTVDATPRKLAQASMWSDKAAVVASQAVERELAGRFAELADALKGDGIAGKKALAAFQKWALQDDPAGGLSVSDAELNELEALQTPRASGSATLPLEFLDAWMDRRSPKWLMGWRDICRSTDERTVIASIVRRVGVGHKMPVIRFPLSLSAAHAAALYGNLCALVLDYAARQKVGGTSLTYHYLKQFPILPPERYTADDLVYIVARVLELTHTTCDMQGWADELTDALPDCDPRPAELRHTPLPPFTWNPERRAQLRAELDAYYAHLYGLDRDELRYILDPADVMGEDYPSETFRVLKTNEMRAFGEYRTGRLVLEAWDRLESMGWREVPAPSPIDVRYSSIGMIQSAEDAKLAGFIAAAIGQRADGITTGELQSTVAHASLAAELLDATEAERLSHILDSIDWLEPPESLSRVPILVQRLEAAGTVVRKRAGSESRFVRGDAALPNDVVHLHEHDELACLLLEAEARRLAGQTNSSAVQEPSRKAQGTS
ncbi:putative type II DNA modification enzyme [Paraburkholderia ribeironis]|uniref:site-specific DNA-methyltransferase (adenine-specific) n=1 Tax=Paraburkholderia ribeironis TaxID=1247936 RepID=A0A1N7S840_9BURK|nr:N-6 DNA methylase [Paraburkholderia ribeironis]SIT43501.1 putative type II DNA modification enzyme [Paraburkholderia ribeironis]